MHPRALSNLVCHAKLPDGSECRGELKWVHLSRVKDRTTTCLKCGHVWLVGGDN